jgi:hypothetical protein
MADKVEDIAGADKNLQGPTVEEKITMTKAELEKLTQAESDKRVAQALKTHDEKRNIEFAQRLEKEKKDAARLAALSEEERHREEMARKEEELLQKGKEITRRELHIDAVGEMEKKDLPVKFAKILLADTAENTLKNINEFEKEWKAELEKAIEQRLRGKTPVTGKQPDVRPDMNAAIREMARRKK